MTLLRILMIFRRRAQFFRVVPDEYFTACRTIEFHCGRWIVFPFCGHDKKEALYGSANTLFPVYEYLTDIFPQKLLPLRYEPISLIRIHPSVVALRCCLWKAYSIFPPQIRECIVQHFVEISALHLLPRFVSAEEFFRDEFTMTALNDYDLQSSIFWMIDKIYDNSVSQPYGLRALNWAMGSLCDFRRMPSRQRLHNTIAKRFHSTSANVYDEISWTYFSLYPKPRASWMKEYDSYENHFICPFALHYQWY